MKKNTTGALRFISKLLLNSLYGRFGMSPVKYETILNENVDLNQSIYDSTALDGNSYLIDKPLSEFRSMNPLINISIAAAITAYSRIHINKYKNIPDNPCIYTDTDSVILTKP
jgi:hypothetical protein